MVRLGRLLGAFAFRALTIMGLLGGATLLMLALASRTLPTIGSPADLAKDLSRTNALTVDLESHATKALQAMLAKDDCGIVQPRADSLAFDRLVAARVLRMKVEAGPEKCDLEMADGVAHALAPDLSRNRRLLFAAKVWDAIPASDLRWFWIESYQFTGEGPYGADAASKRLFGKPSGELRWDEAAVLAVSRESFDEVERCSEPWAVREKRDKLLDRLAALYPKEAAEIVQAKALQIECPGSEGPKP